MSDVPFDGWWQASNGRWYPPETHPAFNAPGPQKPPIGWFQDEDGEWYPPHLRELDAQREADLRATTAAPRRGRRAALVAAWAVVLLVAGGIGIALIGADDDGSPARVGSETTIRQVPPVSVVAGESTTSTTTSTTAPAADGAPADTAPPAPPVEAAPTEPVAPASPAAP